MFACSMSRQTCTRTGTAKATQPKPAAPRHHRRNSDLVFWPRFGMAPNPGFGLLARADSIDRAEFLHAERAHRIRKPTRVRIAAALAQRRQEAAGETVACAGGIYYVHMKSGKASDAVRSKDSAAIRPQLDNNVAGPERLHAARRLIRIRISGEHASFILIDEQQVEVREAALDIFQPPAARIPSGIEGSGQPCFTGVPQRLGRPSAHLRQGEHIGQMKM